jgi:hypothetical protein
MSSGEDASYLKEVQEALQEDPFVKNIRKRLRANKVNNEFKFNDGLVYFKGLLYIPPGPTRLKIIQMHHDLLAAGHFGFNKTMELISQDFWWPQIWTFVKNLYNRVTHVQKERFHDIDHMAFFIRSQFQRIHGYHYQWILLHDFHLLIERIRFLWMSID